MDIYFSPATGGFYDQAFASYVLPPDAVAVTPAQRATIIAGIAQGCAITVVAGVPVIGAVPAPTLAQRQAAAAAAIEAQVTALLAAGVPYMGKRFSAGDASRGNFGGMAAKALAVLAGALPTWDASYAEGWIAVDDTRLPLPTPAAGLALADAVGGWYSRLMQEASAATSAALASDNPEAVLAATNLAAAAASAP